MKTLLLFAFCAQGAFSGFAMDDGQWFPTYEWEFAEIATVYSVQF